jgi:hypothetical protein
MRTSFLACTTASFSFLCASSRPCSARCTLRLWKPVRYSWRESKSKEIESTALALVLWILRLRSAGGMVTVYVYV